MTTRILLRYIVPPLFCAAIPLLCIPEAQRDAVGPNGDESVLWGSLFFVFPALLCTLLVPAALVGLLFKKTRSFSLAIGLCAISFAAAFFKSLTIAEEIRMRAFADLAERSKPLVQAIRTYEARNGTPPQSLDQLVPDLLPAIPTTGMGAYPEYQYLTNTTNFDGNPWVLTVFTPSGGINFDQFMYFPLTNYPEKGYGGTLQKIGDWAYVHE